MKLNNGLTRNHYIDNIYILEFLHRIKLMNYTQAIVYGSTFKVSASVTKVWPILLHCIHHRWMQCYGMGHICDECSVTKWFTSVIYAVLWNGPHLWWMQCYIMGHICDECSVTEWVTSVMNALLQNKSHLWWMQCYRMSHLWWMQCYRMSHLWWMQCYRMSHLWCSVT